MVTGPSQSIRLVRYGAVELKRVYAKNLMIGLSISVVLNVILLSSLWLIVGHTPDAGTQRVIRIRPYKEIALPAPLRTTQFGLSAYPVLPSTPFEGQKPAKVAVHKVTRKPVRPGLSHGVRTRPLLRDLGGLPTADADRLRSETGGTEIHADDGRAPLASRDDIAGGGGPSQTWRAGGTPVPGRTGDSPSGYDASGIGSSAKPSPGTVPRGDGIGIGGGGNGNGGDGLDGYSVRWLQGSVRKKISGDVPPYPPGTNVEAQVQILTTVSPDGTVRQVQPARKSNFVLEAAAMKAVRLWRFEPLTPESPQVDQTCLISFLFRLR